MIFDGKEFAKDKEIKLALKVADLKKQGVTPRLMTILVGDNPESVLYLKLKAKFSQRIGVVFELQQFPEYVKAEEMIGFLTALNNDKSTIRVQGEIVQLPLPKGLASERQRILDAIDSAKDIDGLTATSFELLQQGKKCFLPAVVRAVLEVMDEYELWNKIKVAAVVGAKGWVGERVYWALKGHGIENILEIDLETKNKLSDLTKADLIISCVGKSNLITADLVKDGAMIFDLGVMVVEEGDTKRTVGDVDFAAVSAKTSFITPVPGGIGPVTVACLFKNLLENTIA